jgi:hypothetical protein
MTIRPRLQRAGVVGVAIALAVVASGCHEVTGGGWITSSTGTGKATFGFNARCVVDRSAPGVFAFYRGQFQYNDDAAGVRFHAEITPDAVVGEGARSCEEAADLLATSFGGTGTAILSGEYRPQPKGAPGAVSVLLTDARRPGVGGDVICVTLSDGAHGGYEHCGAVQGGNINVHDHH